MKNSIKTSLVLASLIGSLYAQDTVTLEPLRIDSTAIKTDELRSTDAVEVYTAEDIQKAHVQNVYEFLNQQTSIVTMPSYGNPFSQLIDLHGYGTSNGNQNVVVTVNGRRLNSIDSLAQLLASISPSSIARIEIIKSSGIVVGGDGANAGVINITTKQNNDKEVAFYGGTYGTADGSFYFGHSDDRFSVSASGETQKSDGTRYIDSSGNKDKNKFSTGTFNLSYALTQKLELRLGASFARTDVIYASYLTKNAYNSDPTQKSASFYPSTHQLFDTDTLSAGADYYIDDAFALHIDASHEKKKSDYVTYASVSYYDSDSVKTSLDYITKKVSLSIGYDGFFGDRKSSSDKTGKNNNAGFVMSEFYLGKATFKAGYRLEDVAYTYKSTSSDLNKHVLLHGGELGYNYALDKKSSVFANYSHSYQAPDIDKFFDYGGTFNSFISPMEANNFTFGYNNITNTNKFKISFYYIDLKNEIYYHKTGAFTGENTNIDKSHKYGADLYDKLVINKHFNVALNYNYVQALIDDEKMGSDDYTNKKLPGVSDHSLKATLCYLPNRNTTLALTQIYRSEAYAANDFNNDFSQKQDAYMNTDLSVTYAKKTWEVFAKINNLFNQKNGLWVQDDAIYPVNFTTTATAGLKLRF
ncbi:TonB-dependent receptor [Sulfurimonas sp. HSL-1716]|uniref:TonB-dependent receptor n=1 Tax=Hydrocurvibacter sulfurireducens TaxID=3131937 RepID=UPI0031F95CCF